MAVMRSPLSRGTPAPQATTVTVDWRTGRADIIGTLPSILLQRPGFNPIGFDGAVLPASRYYPFVRGAVSLFSRSRIVAAATA